MEKSAAAIGLLGHDIGVGGVGLSGRAQPTGIDFALATITQNSLAERVLADQAGAEEGEICAETSQVHDHVIRGAAGTLAGLAADIGQLLALRVNVNQFDLIDDPIAASQQAAPGGGAFSIHKMGLRAGLRTQRSVGLWAAICQ